MEKNCYNCKYFNFYYTIFHGNLTKSGGHCINDNVYSSNGKKLFKPRTDCEFWDDRSALTEERREYIIRDLHAMKSRLDEIVKILSLDDE